MQLVDGATPAYQEDERREHAECSPIALYRCFCQAKREQGPTSEMPWEEGPWTVGTGDKRQFPTFMSAPSGGNSPSRCWTKYSIMRWVK